MRIAVNAGGEALGRPTPPDDVVDAVVAAEDHGHAAVWTTHFSRGIDALSVLAVAAARTSRIDLGVGVIPTYPRHPWALAQQAATVQALSGGRLTRGVGVSHRPVIEDLHGLSYASPANHMRDYLSVLVPLLRDGGVRYRGDHYSVAGEFTVPGTSPVSVLVGALGPRMTDVAGELADGVVTWLAGPRVLADSVRRLAAASGGAPRRVVAAMPVAVCDDGDEARSTADAVFSRYGGLDNYRRIFDREGVSTVGELVLAGTEEQVRAALARYQDVGVTELWAVPYEVGGAGTQRTEDFLRGLSG